MSQAKGLPCQSKTSARLERWGALPTEVGDSRGLATGRDRRVAAWRLK